MYLQIEYLQLSLLDFLYPILQISIHLYFLNLHNFQKFYFDQQFEQHHLQNIHFHLLVLNLKYLVEVFYIQFHFQIYIPHDFQFLNLFEFYSY